MKNTEILTWVGNERPADYYRIVVPYADERLEIEIFLGATHETQYTWGYRCKLWNWDWVSLETQDLPEAKKRAIDQVLAKFQSGVAALTYLRQGGR